MDRPAHARHHEADKRHASGSRIASVKDERQYPGSRSTNLPGQLASVNSTEFGEINSEERPSEQKVFDEKPLEEQFKVQQAASEEAKEAMSLHFTLKERPAVIASDIRSFHGEIKESARDCYVSFPGKFLSGWDALINPNADHKQSVACVFLCDSKDGLGKHEVNPEDESGDCYCRTIYGERDFEAFGYLHILPKGCREDQEKRARQNAESTGAIVVHHYEDMEKARQKARKVWESRKKTASWGCAWFQKWKERVEQAVRLKQNLKVVYFPFQVGLGKVQWKDLPTANLWDGVGCGGSQKCEIAYLEKMKQEHPDEGWDYCGIDVVSFLSGEFGPGQEVNALDGWQWRRAEIMPWPKPSPEDPTKMEERVKYTVRCQKTGKEFTTDRVQHADSMQTFLCKVGKDHFRDMLRQILPKNIELLKHHDVILSSGKTSLAVDLEIQTVEAMQELRNAVLSENVEVSMNSGLSYQWQLCIDKTYFCQSYERQLLRSGKLTNHQEEKFREIKRWIRSSRTAHVSAVAGAGKTFIAVQLVLETFQQNPSGHVLLIAPCISSCYLFVVWLGRRAKQENLDFDRLLKRLVVVSKPYDRLLTLEVDGARIKASDSDTREFLLEVCDEAQDVYIDVGAYRGAWSHPVLKELKIHRGLHLSSHSQSSTPSDDGYLDSADVTLTEVVRSTQRIVAGAATFLASASEKQDLRSICPAGPPVKTFIFKPKTKMKETNAAYDYVKSTVAAIWYVIHAYAGLNLHQRLAVIVPDTAFLEWFKPSLLNELGSRIPARTFRCESFEKSLSCLPSDLLRKQRDISKEESDQSDETEMLVVDEIDNSKGLESVIVICVGLDARIVGTQAETAATRARLYRGITRAQVQCIVVNDYLQGGWLEFLGLLRFEEETFVESVGMNEVSAEAAATVVTTRPEERDQLETSKQIPGQQERGHQTSMQVVESAVKLETTEVKDQGQLVSDVHLENSQTSMAGSVTTTSVWDTGENDTSIASQIQKLSFDPRSSLSNEEIKILMVRFPNVAEYLWAMSREVFLLARRVDEFETRQLVQAALRDTAAEFGVENECRFLRVFGYFTAWRGLYEVQDYFEAQGLDPELRSWKHEMTAHWVQLAAQLATKPIPLQPGPVALFRKNDAFPLAVAGDTLTSPFSNPKLSEALSMEFDIHFHKPTTWALFCEIILSLEFDDFLEVKVKVWEAREAEPKKYKQLTPSEILRLCLVQLQLSCGCGIVEVEGAIDPMDVGILATLLGHQLTHLQLVELNDFEVESKKVAEFLAASREILILLVTKTGRLHQLVKKHCLNLQRQFPRQLRIILSFA